MDVTTATPPWGARPEMTDLEAVIWRAEVDPRLRSHGVVLDVLDTTPDWDRLVAAHRWAVALVPRLRTRVVDDPLHLAPPAWIPTELDLDHHLCRIRLQPDDGFDRVLEIAETLYVTPFDVTRPLWQAVLVEGVQPGTTAYLLKFHHAMADGQGTVQLFDLLHGTRRAPTADKVVPEAEPAQPTSPADLLLARSRRIAAGAPGGALRWASAAGRAAAHLALHPTTALSTATQTQGYLRSLARVSGPPVAPSPLLRHRGLARRLRVLDVPLADLKAAGRAAGGTVNDAFLAALLGGLQRYHDHHGVTTGDLPTGLPVSVRTDSDDSGGNRFAGAFIAGPASAVDPATRIRLVHERVLAVRAEPALDFVGSTAPIASRLPSAALARIALRTAHRLDLQASNIPGLGRPAYLGGARIERMYVFGPVPGCAVMATLMSHEGSCGIGIATDHTAIPDPDRLLADLRDAFDEVLALGRVP